MGTFIELISRYAIVLRSLEGGRNGFWDKLGVFIAGLLTLLALIGGVLSLSRKTEED